MAEKKKYTGIKILLLLLSLALPLLFILVKNVWVPVVILVLAEIAVWLGFVYFIRLSAYNAREVMEQGESMDDILKLAYDKCMDARTANKSKSSFLAQMSHEIRTPINAVLGMNEMILREAKDASVLEYASNAYNAGAGLLAIINDILDISKIEAGKLELVEDEYDLYSLVNDCYHMTAERAAKKNLAFLVSVDETLPTKLFGDMFHLRQIVVNFLTNAIKYTDEGSVKLFFAGVRTGDRFSLQVRVKDTGIGLTEENLDKLFTSFQRFDLKRNQSVEGTGLGLSICKQLTELMGGTVEVESVYGQGSTFGCTIPQKVVNETPVGKVVLDHGVKQENVIKTKKFTAPTARILVVDDVQMNLLVFTSLLKEHRFMIDEAMSGKQCLKLVQEKKYDVIFMDHMMPEMDGMETFAHMKEMEHLNKNTPVIMLTANAISGEKEKYLNAGFVSYLTKPIQSDKLEDALLSYIPPDKIVREEILPDAETAEEGAELAAEEDSADKEFFDANLGVFYAGGSREIYETILGSYLDGGANRLSLIRKLCAAEEWKDYATKVHALKSTSLTIGAKELSEAAKELELAAKAGECDKVRRKNDALLSLYERVLAAAEAELGREVSVAEPAGEQTEALEAEEIDGARLRELLERIIAAADNFDMDEITAICDELSACSYDGQPLRETAKKIRTAASDFEYEQAKELALTFLSAHT